MGGGGGGDVELGGIALRNLKVGDLDRVNRSEGASDRGSFTAIHPVGFWQLCWIACAQRTAIDGLTCYPESKIENICSPRAGVALP